MKEERNIITMDGQGNISLPSDIGATAMTEREICELFGVIAPTVRKKKKTNKKKKKKKKYGINRLVRLSDRSSIEVYDLETIAALAFRVESFGAAKVRRALLERIIHGRKEKTTGFDGNFLIAYNKKVGFKHRMFISYIRCSFCKH